MKKQLCRYFTDYRYFRQSVSLPVQKKTNKVFCRLSPCDTVGMQYNRDIVPILEGNCYRCHGTGNTAGSGGILLEGYDNIKLYAQDGRLIRERCAFARIQSHAL